MKGVPWEETKRKVREADPGWDSPERMAEREAGRERLRAEVRGQQLAELRRQAGMTQAEAAAAMGVSQARVSQVEHGQVTSMDLVRDYVAALGGSLDVVDTVGGWSVRDA